MQFIKKILVIILTLESRLIISKYRPFVVAVTGSVGKTSTKDAIYCVLQNQSKFVRKSEKSLNSEIGLPLTIIGVANAWHSAIGWMRNIAEGLRLILHRVEYPDCLILEIGADHPGDIKKVAKWLHPDIVVITKVSNTPVHVEFFSSPEEVFEEKSALAKAVRKNGTLVLFADDAKVMSLSEIAKEKGAKVISYGLDSSSTERGSEQKIFYSDNGNAAPKSPVGISFMIGSESGTVPIRVNRVLGKPHIYTLLAAVAVGRARNISYETIAKSLSGYEAPRGRMNILEGQNGSTIIDDTYNSSPDAVESALETLKDVECSGAKIAVLGDMMELGKFSADEHRKVGKQAAMIANRLILVGPRSKATFDEALKSGMREDSVHSFDSAEEAGEYLVPLIHPGDIVLVKGSQSMRMERAVKNLLKESGKADRLLVRQEKEWLEKK